MGYFKKKNKKAQTGILSLMLGIALFLLTLALAPAVKDVVTGDDVMGVDGLNCSNPSISNQDKAVCTQTDTFQPLWLAIGLGFAGMLLGRVVL